MFSAVKWRPELELGVDMMDRHHRGMVGLCGAMTEKAGARGGAAAVGDLFLEFAGLTAMHFEAEEELMRRSGYPGRMDHQDRHHELSLLLKSWEHRARRRIQTLNPSFLQHLNQWVENHIVGSDRGFSRFLLGQKGSDPTEPAPPHKGTRLAQTNRQKGREKSGGPGVCQGPGPTGNCRLIRQAPVAFKPVSCDRFAQTQPGRRLFDGPVTRVEHF